MQRTAHIQRVLLPEGSVQTVFAEDVCLGSWREWRLLLVKRTAWDGVHEHKGEHRDDQEDDDDAAEATEEVNNHERSAISYQLSASDSQ